MQCQPSPGDFICKAILLFLPVTLREKGNPWQQLWAETERSSPGAHSLLFLLLLFHYLQALPAAQVPDTVGNFLRCISDRTVSTFPNKEPSQGSGQHLLLKARWAETASFSTHEAPLTNNGKI